MGRGPRDASGSRERRAVDPRCAQSEDASSSSPGWARATPFCLPGARRESTARRSRTVCCTGGSGLLVATGTAGSGRESDAAAGIRYAGRRLPRREPRSRSSSPPRASSRRSRPPRSVCPACLPVRSRSSEVIPTRARIVEAGADRRSFSMTRSLNIELAESQRESFRSSNRQIDQHPAAIHDRERGRSTIMRAGRRVGEGTTSRRSGSPTRAIYSQTQEILETISPSIWTTQKRRSSSPTRACCCAVSTTTSRSASSTSRRAGRGQDRTRSRPAWPVSCSRRRSAALIVYKKNWRGSSVAVGDTLWPGNVIMSIVDPAARR